MANKVTKVKFKKVCDKYKPNWWIRIAFKYFSNSTTNNNMKVKRILVTLLLILFFLGAVGVNVKSIPRNLTLGVILSYSFLLAFFVLFILIANIMNNNRINKIIKELGIDRSEYEKLIILYN